VVIARAKYILSFDDKIFDTKAKNPSTEIA
jgi:hypothetical protein